MGSAGALSASVALSTCRAYVRCEARVPKTTPVGAMQRPVSKPAASKRSLYFACRVPVMSAANGDDASNPRAKVSELSEKVVDTNPYSRLMCAGRHRHACCAVD